MTQIRLVANAAGADRGEHSRHVFIAGRERGLKGEAATRLRLAEDAVQREGVEVDVELPAAPEARDHRALAGSAPASG